MMDMADVFLNPSNPTHRQYEALRAYFVEKQPPREVAERFGYSVGSFRVLCSQFRKNPRRDFFKEKTRGPTKAPKRDPVRQKTIELRKKNLSIYEISSLLKDSGHTLSPVSVDAILKEEGFARLPRRVDEERLTQPRPDTAQAADVGLLDLSARSFRTQFGGLFLFLPYLAQIPFEAIMSKASLPGSKKVPAGCAMRSLLAMKLFGKRRNSHVMSHVFDEGLALFAGLNCIPKRQFLTDYSCRIHPASYPVLMTRWFEAMSSLRLDRGDSFDLDFHTIPYHGDHALVEKHYVSKRSRRQKGILAFLAQDAETRVFCYANGDLRKDQQNDEILAFVQYWKKRTGRYPQEVVFDSKLTTQANMNTLNQWGIDFITLRRRTPKRLQEVHQQPLSAWRKIELKNVTRKYRTPKILDRQVTLDDYTGPIREMVIKDLGHEEPTFLLTNQLKRSPSNLVGRYAQRMLIENGIADGIDFFHMDALSSAVAMKINCDLQLTLMASSLYRLLGSQIGRGYEHAKSSHIFRDFVEATAQILITEKDVVVRYQKRANNPLLRAADFGKTNVRIPWLKNKRLNLVLG